MERKDSIEKVFKVWNAVNKIFDPADSGDVLEMVDQIASLFSVGNFYYYILNFITYKIDFASEGTHSVLNIPPEKFTLEKVFDLFHPDDIENLHKKEHASVNFKMNKIAVEDITKYKTVYLIKFVLDDGTEKTILHQSKAIKVSRDGKVQQVLGVHTDVTHLNIPIDDKVAFIGNNIPNYMYNYESDDYSIIKPSESNFSKRELAILKEISKGLSAEAIAVKLNLSPHTVNTHKKNILKKTDCNNTYQLIAKAIREGII